MTASTAVVDGFMTIDVTLSFTISVMATDVKYLAEEISTWRARDLQSLAVNQRTIFDDNVKRQQWDVFRRNGPVLEAYRVQAKRLDDFRQHHAGFVQHWAPATFGAPWLQDFAHAPPDRRPDLDLPASAKTQAPLALAFYWSRFLPDQGGTASLVLPGFKRDKTADLRFAPPTPGDTWRRFSAPLTHPGLESNPTSLAAAWVSPHNDLMQLGFDLHTSWASGQALLRAQGCEGVAVRPD